MLFKTSENGRFVSGRVIKNAELQKVGAKKTDKVSLSVAYGMDKDQVCNLTVWADKARICADVMKWDYIMATGEVNSHEYNGKTYSDINVDCIIVQKATAAQSNRAAFGAVPDLSALTNNPDDFQQISSADIPF